MEMSSIVVGDEEQEAATFNEDLKRFVQILRTVTHAHICETVYIDSALFPRKYIFAHFH